MLESGFRIPGACGLWLVACGLLACWLVGLWPVVRACGLEVFLQPSCSLLGIF